MTQCNTKTRLNFQSQLPVDVEFSAHDISSDGGAVLLREAEDRLGICEAIADLVPDGRDPGRVLHSRKEQVLQRVVQIALGYADQNDAKWLRDDPVLKTACGDAPDGRPLSSQATLSRLENAPPAAHVEAMQWQLIFSWIRGLDKQSREVTIDIDSSAFEGHGAQQELSFCGFHRCCRFRKKCGHFFRNLQRRKTTSRAARVFADFDYQAGSWKRARHIVGKAEVTLVGDNPRFVVTNLDDFPARLLYEVGYCGRGRCEQSIGEFKGALEGDRISCHAFDANGFRLILHALAYRLLFEIRRTIGALASQDDCDKRLSRLARASFATLRLRLLKVAFIVRQSVRRIFLQGSRSFPLADIFHHVARAMA